MRLLAALLTLILANCSTDRGRCLSSRQVPELTMLQPHLIGRVTVLIPTIMPAHDVCDSWEFPGGRR